MRVFILNTDAYGFIAAFLTTIAFLPQVWRTFRSKSANDVSASMLILFILGLIFWVVYGFQSHSIPVLLANVITLILNLSILSMKLLYSQDIR